MTGRAHREALAGGLLVAAIAVAYLPLRSAGFIWDDDAYVTGNANLASLAGLVRIWIEPRSIPQYYPLVHTTFWIEARLFGLDARAFHATNVLLHAASALLLWRILVLLAAPGAFFAAALFAAHPVMVESVAWITERKNVLSMALALGSLALYLRFDPLGAGGAGKRRWRPYGLSLALYAAALLSKSVVCSLPAVIAVLAWWKRGRIGARDLGPLAPFFALGLAAAAVTVWLERTHVGATGAEWSLGPIERGILAGRALWFYAGKLAWPEPLIFFYPRWRIDAADAWQLLYPASALAVGAALFAARDRIGRGAAAAVAIFAGVLFPALGFFDVYPFRYSFVADHFQYHASAALLALGAGGAARGAATLGANARAIARAGAVAVVVALGVLSYRQAHVYHDLETLYRHTIAMNPAAWNAHLNLANHLSSQGRNAEALFFAREAARLAPQLADSHNTLGGVSFLVAAEAPARGAAHLAEAIAAFERALAIDPHHVDALHNAAVALEAAGRPDEAARLRARIAEQERAGGADDSE